MDSDSDFEVMVMFWLLFLVIVAGLVFMAAMPQQASTVPVGLR